MKLYYSPGACSIGIHYLLERLEIPYERQKVDIRAGETRATWFLDRNPKGKVPVLERDDGSALTEFPVIAQHLASTEQGRKILPAEPEVALRAAEMTDFLVATVHMQGFSRILRPAKFSTDPEAHQGVVEQGRALVTEALQVVELGLKPGGALAGRPTFADAALFYILFWAVERAKLDVPRHCAERYGLLKASPAGQRTFAAEGITL